jgi:hypothetical protein
MDVDEGGELDRSSSPESEEEAQADQVSVIIMRYITFSCLFLSRHFLHPQLPPRMAVYPTRIRAHPPFRR